ncbi:restriction endonuclease subunit S [Litoribaculum gwangyangense]|uniref:Restriction endonuclease subunit S n=1 Tax=Litoribaculum gwangyangense TaxID=1130722 RepID=A0ABP9BZF8_9FLAO
MSWEQVISNEVLDIRDGTHDSPKYIDMGYPLITSKNLKQGIIDFSDVSLISEDDYVAINKRSKVDKGDILYSMIGSIGNYALVDEEPNYAIKNVALFKFNDTRLHNKYFLHLLNSFVINRQIEKAMKGGTQKFVSLKILRNLKIPLPPLDQQKQIAKILDTADGYRQKTKALIEKYDALTQSLFLDMFGDPVTNPKGWEQLAMEQIVSEKCPMAYGIVQPGEDLEEGIPVVRPVDFTMKTLKSNGLKKVAIEIANQFDRTKLQGGELLVTVRGTIGLVAIADKELKGANVTRGVVPIWLDNSSNCTLEYLYYLFSNNRFRTFVDGKAKGATLRGLNLKDLRAMLIICPDLQLQKIFTERVKSIEAQKALVQQEFDKADYLFNSLLQKAFKGKLTN